MEDGQGGLGVSSEVGVLEAVLLHRPGLELRRLTPDNKDELLFDELLWLEHAQGEHDAFARVLTDAGVEVLLVEDLLAEVLADDEVATRVIAEHVTTDTTGPVAVDDLRAHLAGMDPAMLAASLYGGVAVDEVDVTPGLVTAMAPPGAMLLNPLPNAVFMRDSSAWIADGVALSPMNRAVRRRETALVRTVVTTHPRFAAGRIWFGAEHDEHLQATFEGGDILVVGERALAVGMSERTTAPGIEALALNLFEEDVVDRILVVDLPKVRAAMHLDTIVTQVDVDAFITYPSMTRDITCHQLTPRRGAGGLDGIRVADASSMVRGLEWASGVGHIRAIEPDLGSTRAAREQWNDANNTLALAPGRVIAYERNVATNTILADAGIEVLTIPSFELPRGRGGPRCMSCPLSRAPLDR
ncbi:arginine deiminase [Salsipaludibacter albus]|uniref:arginine deiminase n=1 Tax=Salsipaludibacter albus TaxID=2849650 RepID=UPI001EE3DBAC|nr:arginine deiminase [Salsipaludibacter albus]